MPEDKEVKPINASLDDLARNMMRPAPLKPNKNNELLMNTTHQPAPPDQGVLDLGIEIERNINGIEMGVLENGIPYLTQVGIANLSGVARSTIFELTKEWSDKYEDPILIRGRNSFLKSYLFEKGYNQRSLYIQTMVNGSVHYAYPDIVCMAILEYYAFEAQNSSKDALSNYRILARYGLEQYIYNALNYSPEDKWKYFRDRVSILNDSSPDGFFIIFNETTGLAVDLIGANLTINHKTIPDISVGIAWRDYWTENNMEDNYGSRKQYLHNYPDYYPQATSNPQKAWAYPDAALPVFRHWFKSEYLLTKFPKYILTKANILLGGREEAKQISSMYSQKQIKK